MSLKSAGKFLLCVLLEMRVAAIGGKFWKQGPFEFDLSILPDVWRFERNCRSIAEDRFCRGSVMFGLVIASQGMFPAFNGAERASICSG
jgi:hypothetical protein